MDFADDSDSAVAMYLAQALHKAGQTDAPLTSFGICLFCDEPTGSQERRWCDGDCARLWEKEKAMGRITGRPLSPDETY